MTFCATVNTIIHSGATPVLVDIDSNTWNIDPKKIEEKITKKTKAIIPVHFAGRSCDMDSIMKIAKKYNLFVIEDCAHAIETEYKGKKAGTIGHFGVFSFYATKNLVTGEGGMVISKDKDKISRIRKLGLHGMSIDAWKRFSDQGYKHYLVEEAGFKYNMLDLQAAIGIHQLKRIKKYSIRREKIWNHYLNEFYDLPISMASKVEKNTKHAYHLFILRINEKKCGINRDEFLLKMNDKKIGCGVHYRSIPDHPFYIKKYNWKNKDYKNSIDFGNETVSIPISGSLSDNDVERVTNAVKDIIIGR
jgi:dTDP-4-amino-4,6-dideoxygalactose transaminase